MTNVVSVASRSFDDAAHAFSKETVQINWLAMLTKIAVAAVIAAVGVLIVWLGRKVIRKLLKTDKADGPENSHRKTLQTLLCSLFGFAVYFAAGCMALSALGVNVGSLLAVAGVGGLAIGFGCQTLVKDFVSGLFLWIEGKIKVGDIVTVGGMTGTVESMALRTTTLRSVNGNLYTIPNGDIRTVVNMTRDYRCALVNVTLSHGQDYALAMEKLQQAMAELDEKEAILEEAPKVVGLIANDRFSVTVRIECKCQVNDCWEAERKIRLAALECLKKEGFVL